MVKFVAPEHQLQAFNCPFCGAFSHMRWVGWNDGGTHLAKARCAYCKKESVWFVIVDEDVPFGDPVRIGTMIYPDSRVVQFPENDMPDDVKRDYEEAASIFKRSPRAAAALLRLALQRLCKHLGGEGKNINDDIRSLAANNVIPVTIVRVADTVRITGNNAVHPGEMAAEDVDYVASKMFELLNIIVRKGITEPKEIESLYNMVPEGPRKSAEAKDAMAKDDD